MTGSLGGISVAVNLLWCVPGGVGGSEEHSARQLLGLAEVAPLLRLTAYAPRGWAAAHPDVAAAVDLVEASIDGSHRPRRVAAEATWLRWRTRDAGLVHHMGGTVPPGGRAPVVLTLHDLQWHTHPEYVSPLKRRYLTAVVPRSLRGSRIVTVPSAFVARTVIDAYGLPDDRVVVVPHGLEPTLGAGATEPAELRRRYRLGDGPVVVYPAVTHPHKQHVFLLRLLAERWTDPDLRLVLTGGTGLADEQVTAEIDRLGLADRVVRTGRVPPADRDGLIGLADALVFPSQYEGFGAPVIEAMALGTPVIASDRASLPEVVGDAGLVLPLDLDAWSGALDDVGHRRDELIAAGRARAGTFTTAATGAALLAAYRRAVA